uniref:Uncharacterized protein n=1 Tax=Sphaeramia orbicularis TaxID=375764 RepID=A0A673AGA2_9TELE
MTTYVDMLQWLLNKQSTECTLFFGSPCILSPRSPSGCVLPTCAYTDLIDKLHRTMDPPKLSPVPKEKLSPDGYGRRRRRHSPLKVTQAGRGEA